LLRAVEVFQGLDADGWEKRTELLVGLQRHGQTGESVEGDLARRFEPAHGLHAEARPLRGDAPSQAERDATISRPLGDFCEEGAR
jgi:hypothetical protein